MTRPRFGVKGGEDVTDQQYKHVEEQLIAAIDTIVQKIEKGNATSAEIAALPEIAFALDKISTP